MHHPNLTEDKEADDDGAEDVLNEKDLRKIGFEAQILRMVTSCSTVTTSTGNIIDPINRWKQEGKIEEAMVLEAYIRRKRMDKLKYGISAVQPI